MRGIPAEAQTLQHLTFIIYHNRLCNIGTLQGHFVSVLGCRTGPPNIRSFDGTSTCLLQSA